ncbi:MAG TPA: hypothetical protein VGC27_00240, partial [Rhizomicrobium sp.]
MKLGAIAALLVGLAIAIFVLLHIGIAPVLDAVASVSWGGFVLICLFGLLPPMLSGLAVYALLPGQAPWLVFLA